MDPREVVLGTANLGMPYGISKAAKACLVPRQVEALLAGAASLGINVVDTSPAYGNAESIVGAYDCFKVVTKVQKIDSNVIRASDIDAIERVLQNSLEKVGRESFYGLLVHQPDDLFKKGAGLLVEWMQSVRSKGVASKIGVSVYSTDEVDKLYTSFPFDIVQLPLNIMNQSFVCTGAIEMLAQKGVEIHARSLFLKGVLLKMDLSRTTVSHELGVYHLKYLKYLREVNCSLLDACKLFAQQQTLIDKWVIGVGSKRQLDEILSPIEYDGEELSFTEWSNMNQSFSDPRRWN